MLRRVGITVIALVAGLVTAVPAAAAQPQRPDPFQVHLEVIVPPQVSAGAPFIAEIKAERPDGGPAWYYHGTVALRSSDCTMSPHQNTPAVRITFGRPTVYVAVTLSLTNESAAHQLLAYDLANKHVSGVSNTFDVLGFVPDPTCPVAYH